MARRGLLLCCVALGAAVTGIHSVQAQASLPDLSGTYRCVPDTRPCPSPTFTVSQSGSKLSVKSEKGDIGTGQVTSNETVSLGAPWNMLGTILPGERTIQWAAGTQWQKQ